MLKSVIPAMSSLALFACTQSTETPDPATDWQTILAEQGLAAAEAVLIETAVSPDEQFARQLCRSDIKTRPRLCL